MTIAFETCWRYWENDTHPMAHGEMKGKVIRSIKKNRSHVVCEVRRTRLQTPLHSLGGQYLGTAPAIPIEQAQVERTFGRMAGWLFCRLCGEQRFPFDSNFEVGTIHPMAKEQTVKMFDRLGARMFNLVDTFYCAFVVPKDAPTGGIWLLQFINVLFQVPTNVALHLPAAPRPMTSWLR